jgi:hypothetical protein
MLRLEIDRRWEPEDFIEVLKGLESLYYKAVISSPRFYEPLYYQFEWPRFSGSFQDQLDISNDWLLDQARTIAPGGSRLSLTRIEYASPGGIDLVGLGQVCNALDRVLGRLIKLFTERTLRRERAAQAQIRTAMAETEFERDQESLRAVKIANARELLSLRRDFPEIHEDFFLSLTARDQDKLIPRIAQRKLIGASTLEDDAPPPRRRGRRRPGSQ